MILELQALAGIKLKISSGKGEKKECVNKCFLYNNWEIKVWRKVPNWRQLSICVCTDSIHYMANTQSKQHDLFYVTFSCNKTNKQEQKINTKKTKKQQKDVTDMNILKISVFSRKHPIIWNKVLKNGPSKIFGTNWKPLKHWSSVKQTIPFQTF